MGRRSISRRVASASLGGSVRSNAARSFGKGRRSVQQSPHFVRDYRRFVQKLNASGLPRDEAMGLAVGGNYEQIGQKELKILLELGLFSGAYLIDVGCGSGRLANAVAEQGPDVRYLGTDVVADLLQYAKERTESKDWTFVQVDGLFIPEKDAQADFVVFFSVLTHLNPQESLAYLREAKRVLKRGGKIVASYLDPTEFSLSRRVRFAVSAMARLILRRSFKSVYTRGSTVQAWARALDMNVELKGALIGQSIAVFQRKDPTGA